MNNSPPFKLKVLLLVCLLVTVSCGFTGETDERGRESKPPGIGCSSVNLVNSGYSVFGKNGFEYIKLLNGKSSVIYQTNYTSLKLPMIQQLLSLLLMKGYIIHVSEEHKTILILEAIYNGIVNHLSSHIPFDESPKIMITTNYAVLGKGGSFEKGTGSMPFAS